MNRPALAVALAGTLFFALPSQAEVDAALFAADALVLPPSVLDCRLITGAAARCLQIVVKYKPDGLEIGPFCPETLEDNGGIWNWDGDRPGLYRLDRAFFEMLHGMGYAFHGEDGRVHIADPGAGRPEWDNACLQASDAPQVQMTMLIPVDPVPAEAPTDLGTVAAVGVGLDGVPIFADAPSVRETGHLPALDLCGGHVDPGGWYHWHGTATDINAVFAGAGLDAECALAQSASVQFGYAYDGYAMFGRADADGRVPADLDACGGHTGATPAHPEGGYYDHAAGEFPNLPRCLVGVQAEANFTTTASQGIGAERSPWWWPF